MRGSKALLAQAVVALSVTAGANDAAIRVEDDAGKTFSFDAPVQRIVSLAPHITELLFAAGAGEKIVGTVRFSDFPEAAKAIPRIGDSSRLDFERLVALEPDVIVFWSSGGGESQLAKLSTLDIPVYTSEPRKVADISISLIRFGRLAGTVETARLAARDLEARIESLKSRYSDRPAVRVFYHAWTRPLLTVNGEHLFSDVMRLCGGVNVFAAAKPLSPVVSVEAALGARPDVVLTTHNEADAARDFWGSFKSVNATLVVLEADTIARHTPRIADGAKALCEKLEEVRRFKIMERRIGSSTYHLAP